MQFSHFPNLFWANLHFFRKYDANTSQNDKNKRFGKQDIRQENKTLPKVYAEVNVQVSDQVT